MDLQGKRPDTEQTEPKTEHTRGKFCLLPLREGGRGCQRVRGAGLSRGAQGGGGAKGQMLLLQAGFRCTTPIPPNSMGLLATSTLQARSSAQYPRQRHTVRLHQRQRHTAKTSMSPCAVGPVPITNPHCISLTDLLVLCAPLLVACLISFAGCFGSKPSTLQPHC